MYFEVNLLTGPTVYACNSLSVHEKPTNREKFTWVLLRLASNYTLCLINPSRYRCCSSLVIVVLTFVAVIFVIVENFIIITSTQKQERQKQHCKMYINIICVFAGLETMSHTTTPLRAPPTHFTATTAILLAENCPPRHTKTPKFQSLSSISSICAINCAYEIS